ncbi:MAG: threonine--tRNA ligase [Myxococcota bacterium]
MSDAHDEMSYDFVPRELSEVDTVRHSCAHLLASAVAELYPGTKFGFGPHVEHGFYYDLEIAVPEGRSGLSPEDLPAIEDRMREIAKGNHKFEHFLLSKEQAVAWAKETDQGYKLEAMERIEAPVISFYRHGTFTDMCAGPHVGWSKKLKHFKLTSIAGAYWRGDVSRPMLTRIYGVAFDTKEALDAHLTMLEESKKRDHRRLGPQLGLFMFHEYAPGAAFWLERGEHVYHLLAERMRTLLLSDGYISVRTPMLFDKRLWQTSGHWDHYQENMFHFAEGHFHEGEEAEGDSKIMGLKPMNCPSHMLIFKSRKFSYRDLPFRVHDQGVLHRNELRGALGGLTRVRQFSQDDAHLFCMPEQIESEVQKLLDLVNAVYRAFDMRVIPKLSTRPESRMGDEALWDQAESALRDVLDRNGIEWKLNAGDGTFYGPKIDFDVLDALGRAHQCATIQIDFQLPIRFALSYTGADNQAHTPVVIHRAILGSFERFIGILVEHYAGKFPTWLAPEQVRVLTVSEKSEAGGRRTRDALASAGLMVQLDDSANKIGYKIREGHAMAVPYLVVIGEREQEEGTVSVRSRDAGDLGAMALDAFVDKVRAEAVPPF